MKIDENVKEVECIKKVYVGQIRSVDDDIEIVLYDQNEKIEVAYSRNIFLPGVEISKGDHIEIQITGKIKKLSEIIESRRNAPIPKEYLKCAPYSEIPKDGIIEL